MADALYLNEPFITTVQKCRMHVVIRLKNENMHIYQDAEGLFKNQEPVQTFEKNKIRVQVWDDVGFEMERIPCKLRVIKFVECHRKEKTPRQVWIVTDLGG